MNTTKTLTEEVEDESKVTPLKLLTGGKGTQDPNWLKNLNTGTVFLTRPRKDNYGNVNLTEGLALLEIIAKTERAARLYDSINQNSFMVDMQRFSNRMELFEILGQIEEKSDV